MVEQMDDQSLTDKATPPQLSDASDEKELDNE
jgi:hypothetical protein